MSFLTTMPHFYKLILSYDGSHYSGWQFQAHNPNTIQQKLNEAIYLATNTQQFSTYAASRTDKGVHALFQIAKLTINLDIKADLLCSKLNEHLPSDIRVDDTSRVRETFNPITQTKLKTYRYYFSSGNIMNRIHKNTFYYHKELNIELMKKACSFFVGEHSFQNFCVQGSRSVNFNRELVKCSFHKDKHINDVFYLELQAKGFLKYMVRFISGSIIKAGSKELCLNKLEDAIHSPEIPFKAYKAPAEGLVLCHIELY